VIGTVLANPFLNPAVRMDPNARVTLADVVRHIDHTCQLTGSAAHCALGSDFDGGFGVQSSPRSWTRSPISVKLRTLLVMLAIQWPMWPL
jgi:membrane dipeptidase